MRKLKLYLPIALLMGCMLAAICFALGLQLARPPLEQITFHDSVTGNQIFPHTDPTEGKTYLFLPAHCAPEDVTVSAPFGTKVTFSQNGSLSGAVLEGAEEGEPLTVTLRTLLGVQQAALELHRAANLPTLYIQGDQDFLTYLDGDKTRSADVMVTAVSPEGELLLHRLAAMSGRGNGSRRDQAKRPYNLTFDGGVDLGPFQDIEKLCLLAEYSDESRMRSALTYYGAKQMGIPYATDYLYVNVYVNGQFRGLHGIVTKQEYQKYVDTDKVKAVFEISGNDYNVAFWSAFGSFKIRVMYGSADLVQERVNSFEHSLNDQNWSRCADKIDMDSFARKYILEEFFGNTDLGFASQYFYIDEQEIIHCMLPWDYDWTMGSSITHYNNRQEYELKAYRHPDSWYTLLLESEQFRLCADRAADTYLTEDYIAGLDAYLSQISELIASSRDCDLLRWKNERPFNTWDLRSGLQTTEQFRQTFSQYFPKRQALLQDCFANWDSYALVNFTGEFYSNFFLPKGTPFQPLLEGSTVQLLPEWYSRFPGWTDAQGRAPEDIGIVTEDILFSERATP